jgi:hypothetical protein
VAMSGTGRRRRGPVGGLTVHPWVGTADWSAAMSGTGREGLVGGDVGDRRRRRGPVGGLVGPPVGGDVGGPVWRRCRGPVGRTGRGDVGDRRRRRRGPGRRTGRSTRGGDVGGPVGGDVGGTRRTGGDVGDWSAAKVGDWSGLVGPPAVATLADWLAAMSGGLSERPVGGDVGGLVGGVGDLVGGLVEPGGWDAGGPMAAMSGTGRDCRWRRGLVGGVGGLVETGSVHPWATCWRTGRRRRRGPGRRTGRWRCRGTGRRRRRGLVGGLVGPPVVATLADYGGDGGPVEDWSVAMSGTGRRRRRGTGRYRSVHPRVATLADRSAAMSGTGRSDRRWRHGGINGGDAGTGRRTGRSTRGVATLADRSAAMSGTG